jgi:hypothetical protein
MNNDRLEERHYESVVPGSSVDGVDVLSRLILAAVAPALFPRKRFRMSSLKNVYEKA